MRIIAQISDLHFGTEILNVCDALVNDLHNINPNLLVISGDFTQRARSNQYQKAADYIKKLPTPQLVIPGNHDVPLFDVFRRFFAPLTRYKKYISEDLNPFYKDDEIAVLAINTARSFVWKGGRISEEQIAMMKEKLCPIDEKIFKIVVTHHPFIPPPEKPNEELVNRAELAMRIIDPCNIDLLLAGHLHKSYTGDAKHLYKLSRSVVVAQAGTAMSDRVRGEGNSYNVIQVERNLLKITVRVFKEETGKFEEGKRIIYKKDGLEWSEIAEKDNLPK